MTGPIIKMNDSLNASLKKSGNAGDSQKIDITNIQISNTGQVIQGNTGGKTTDNTSNNNEK